MYYHYIMNNDAHKHLALEDTLALIGELEHARRHNLRSYYSATEQEDKFFYLVTAAQAQRLRRKVQGKLGNIDTEDWCILKSAQAIRQLNYELMEGDEGLFNDLESFVDSINTHALKQDMSGCRACQDDRNEIKSE